MILDIILGIWLISTVLGFICIWIGMGIEEKTYFPFEDIQQMLTRLSMASVWPALLVAIGWIKYNERRAYLTTLRANIEKYYEKDWYD